MSTDRIAALTALDDSDKPWRLESDKLLRLAINHKAATPFLGIARLNPRIYKAAAGDDRSIEFRIGEPDANDTSDSSTLGFSIKHSASGELQIFASNGIGVKIAADGTVNISGNTAFAGNVTFGGTIPNPLPGYPQFLTATATVDPPSISPGADYVFDMTVSGVLLSKCPAVDVATNLSSAVLASGISITAAWASADNTVSLNYHNYAGGSINIASHTARAYVWQM